MTYKHFERDIVRMNSTYELGVVDTSNNGAMYKRAEAFKSIINEECGEIEEVLIALNTADTDAKRIAARVMLADLLGDLIVYCASEAERWDIPIAEVLQIIMESNFSKLDENGRPIKDERGKFLKGPNYWRPEPRIKELLESRRVGAPQEAHIPCVKVDMDAVVAQALAPKEKQS